MAMELLSKKTISTFGNLSFRFLNKKGKEIHISKVTVHEVFLNFRGKKDLSDSYSIVNNHLNIFIDSNRYFPKKITKFNVIIRYSYKGHEDDILTHKITCQYEPLKILKPRKKGTNSDKRR